MDKKQEQIKHFLGFLNDETPNFILKGGNALAQCYNLPRMSDDIDLDSAKEGIFPYVESYCKRMDFQYRVAKNTNTVKRCLIHFSEKEKPLKIEVSYRSNVINLRQYPLRRDVCAS